jgi:hypothetical protein
MPGRRAIGAPVSLGMSVPDITTGTGQGWCDLLVGRCCRVLVDQCGSRAVVADPGLKVGNASTALGSEGVAGMPEVVDVQALHADG